MKLVQMVSSHIRFSQMRSDSGIDEDYCPISEDMIQQVAADTHRTSTSDFWRWYIHGSYSLELILYGALKLLKVWLYRVRGWGMWSYYLHPAKGLQWLVLSAYSHDISFIVVYEIAKRVEHCMNMFYHLHYLTRILSMAVGNNFVDCWELLMFLFLP